MDMFNRYLSGKRIIVEWGIGGLKMRWRILRNYRYARELLGPVFRACARLYNYVRRQRDYKSQEVTFWELEAENSDPRDKEWWFDADQQSIDNANELDGHSIRLAGHEFVEGGDEMGQSELEDSG